MQNFSAEVITRSLGEVGSTVFFILVGTVILELILYGVFGRLLKSRYTLPIMLLGPAAVGLAVLIVYPLLWEFNLSFTNMSLRRFGDKAQYTWLACQDNPEEVGCWLTDFLINNYSYVFSLPVL
jgi:hypothetical protein